MSAYTPPSHSGPLSLTALVVHTNLSEVFPCIASLTQVGFRVTTVDSFERARATLEAHAPLLLVTDLTLAEYNGLHLVLRARSLRDSLKAVVLSRIHDNVLRAETEKAGATFVPTPLPPEELRAAVFRTLLRASSMGGPIRAPFERRHGERRQVETTPLRSPERRDGDRRIDTFMRLREHAAPAP